MDPRDRGLSHWRDLARTLSIVSLVDHEDRPCLYGQRCPLTASHSMRAQSHGSSCRQSAVALHTGNIDDSLWVSRKLLFRDTVVTSRPERGAPPCHSSSPSLKGLDHMLQARDRKVFSRHYSTIPDW